MRSLLGLAALLLASTAHAQGLSPSAPATADGQPVPTATQFLLLQQQLQQQMAAAQAAADTPAARNAAIAAAAPGLCPTPAGDTLNGTAGGAAGCIPRQDAARPTAVRRANATTDSTGAFSLTWARAYVSTTPVVSVKPVLAAGTKGDCGFTTVNATTAAGTCWTYQSVVVSVLGSTVSPVATAAAGIRVMLVGGEPTQ